MDIKLHSTPSTSARWFLKRLAGGKDVRRVGVPMCVARHMGVWRLRQWPDHWHDGFRM